MVCIHCGAKTHVINSRSQARLNQVWRRRQCWNCGAIFTTEEKASYGAVWRIKMVSGALTPFSRDKLFMSLYKACEHRKTALADAGALTDTVIKKLIATSQDGLINRAALIQTAQVALNRFDKAASVAYQVRHKS